MGQKTYWRGVEDLKQDAASTELQKQKENFEIEKVFTEESGGQMQSNRRDFLKVLGFSVTAATLAASCKVPVRKAIPYVNKPESITPGMPTYYASFFYDGHEFVNVLAKTREGRPIKLEPNNQAGALTRGTSSATEASVLSLYDNYRLHGPMMDGKPSDWKAVDASISARLNGNQGQRIALITNTIISPSTRRLINEFKNKYTGTEHIVFDGISYSGLLEANANSFGSAMIPSYNFDKAKAIVGINCDFLGSWLFPQKFSADYAETRKVNASNRKMSRHFQFESWMSLTGSNADYRYSMKPGSEAKVVSALLAAVQGGSAGSTGEKFANAEAINACAKYLRANGSSSLVVCGSNDPAVQQMVNQINQALGAIGTTVDTGKACHLHQGSDAALMNFANNASSYDAVIFWGANPVYNMPNGSKLAEAIAKVPLSISMNERIDETSVNCMFACPDNHGLESWNDALPIDGHYAIQQPTIAPLFDTRQGQESLMTWMGQSGNYHDYIKSAFSGNWNKALHDGFVNTSVSMPSTNSFVPSGAGSASISGGTHQLTFSEDIALGDGSQANNPWLQEVPDPVSRVCWTNYVAMSAQEMESKGIKQGQYAVVSANGGSIKLPILSQPGLMEGCISIALGYGRTGQKQGKVENNLPCGSGLGENVAKIMGMNGGNRAYATSCDVKIESGSYDFAQTQMHHTIEGLLIDQGEGKKELDKRLTSNYSYTGMGEVTRASVFKETTLPEYVKNPYAGNEDRAHVIDHMQTLYPEHPMKGHHWGMVIDLNACNGCNACVVSCNAENNVPVVGEREVHRAHEMHWLRIDRYYAGDVENPDVVFQPMMCQHCDNAPCENVCPVAATNHSSEGINQMAYNRCIGTRYCANNCPYKVRRFNWFDYMGADSFTKGTIFGNDKGVSHMLEDLTRMVLNPDVTVRSRGVMEKCTFCVQRIQDGKLTAKKEGRKLNDGDIVTACQSSCATGAIKFGDLNDKSSEVYQLANLETGDERGFKVLEEIHVLPSITYLTKVRNRDESKG